MLYFIVNFISQRYQRTPSLPNELSKLSIPIALWKSEDESKSIYVGRLKQYISTWDRSWGSPRPRAPCLHRCSGNNGNGRSVRWHNRRRPLRSAWRDNLATSSRLSPHPNSDAPPLTRTGAGDWWPSTHPTQTMDVLKLLGYTKTKDHLRHGVISPQSSRLGNHRLFLSSVLSLSRWKW